MITEDKGFVSKYDGTCVICKAYYRPGNRIATAPVPYHIRRPSGAVMRFAHLQCALHARKTPVVFLGGEA